MKKVLYSIGTVGFLTCMVFTVSTSISNPFGAITTEAVAQASTGSVVCHCTWLGKCKASGNGNICASGDNINCQDWNGNC